MSPRRSAHLSPGPVSKLPGGLVAVIATLLVAPVAGCGGGVEREFARMIEIEHRLDDETKRLQRAVRTLEAHWDVSDLVADAEAKRRQFLATVHDRYHIQEAHEEGEASRTESLKSAAAFLQSKRALLDEIVSQRELVEVMRRMTDTAKLRLSEVGERMRSLGLYIASVRDDRLRTELESRAMVLTNAIQRDARFYLESGMREVQRDIEKAEVLFEAGIRQLDEIDHTIDELLVEVRAALEKDERGVRSEEDAGTTVAPRARGEAASGEQSGGR